MINILSTEQKKELRAARINVLLVRYSMLVVVLAVVIGMVYGVGFYLVAQDENAVKEKLIAQDGQAKAYAAVEKEAEDFRNNLSVAKSILSKETMYSDFLLTLANDLPSGAILTSFSIGGPTTAASKNGMLLDARVNSYTKLLELKDRLEKSELFENVNIVSTSRPDDIAGLTGIEAKYPFEASYNVKLSKRTN